MPPYGDRFPQEKLHEFFDAALEEPVERIPEKWSADFADFVDKCLRPKKRLSIEQLFQHEFLQNAEQLREVWMREHALHLSEL